ncbi:UPF0691 protein C9orf116 isoform X2 [Hyposmocoma kahamanoa]|uniref:UPF0691 protein C9orf116 isoform X2 n=1 Tax=Hyposmocoma kahamanoa TaxID=1477025 RepID=UPI000E6D8409|nr:UPF0691 protein C9orf116 isoform X2 [Hyposmocoma kahamanoa]
MNEPVCHNLLKSAFDENLDEQREKDKEAKEAHDDLPATKKCAGYCSAYCTNKDCLRAEIQKPPLKTSDIYATCDLPKRFEHPHWFNGYGCQTNYQHPFYRTSSSEYGWYPPGYHSVPSVFYPQNNEIQMLFQFGMYRNYALNAAHAGTPNYKKKIK